MQTLNFQQPQSFWVHRIMRSGQHIGDLFNNYDRFLVSPELYRSGVRMHIPHKEWLRFEPLCRRGEKILLRVPKNTLTESFEYPQAVITNIRFFQSYEPYGTFTYQIDLEIISPEAFDFARTFTSKYQHEGRWSAPNKDTLNWSAKP